jgi:hypothetical protein
MGLDVKVSSARLGVAGKEVFIEGFRNSGISQYLEALKKN